MGSVGVLVVAALASLARSVHKPFRQIMSLAGCTVTQPFARSNRAPPVDADAGVCQNPFTQVEVGSGAVNMHDT